MVGATDGAFTGEAAIGGADAFLTRVGVDGAVLGTTVFGTGVDDRVDDVALTPRGDVLVRSAPLLSLSLFICIYLSIYLSIYLCIYEINIYLYLSMKSKSIYIYLNQTLNLQPLTPET